MKESESNICQVAVILEWMPGKSMYKYWGKNAGQACESYLV